MLTAETTCPVSVSARAGSLPDPQRDVDPVGSLLVGALGVGHRVLTAEQCLRELLQAADEAGGGDDFLTRSARLLRPFSEDLVEIEVFTEER